MYHILYFVSGQFTFIGKHIVVSNVCKHKVSINSIIYESKTPVVLRRNPWRHIRKASRSGNFTKPMTAVHFGRVPDLKPFFSPVTRYFSYLSDVMSAQFMLILNLLCLIHVIVNVLHYFHLIHRINLKMTSTWFASILCSIGGVLFARRA